MYVSGGSFEMGKELGTAGSGDTTPVHTVTLTSGFYMGKYPVTQGQYKAVMGALPSSLPGSSYGVGDNNPVYFVSWYDAIVFCNRLSIAEGLSPAYRINNSTNPSDWGTVPTSSNTTWNAAEIVSGSTGYRLSTEAQWEYAAKGGDPTANGWVGYTYSGSDTVRDVAWYSGNSSSRTHEVGTKQANGLGIHDMSGNVLEWCWDWYASYSSGAVSDPAGPGSGSDRVIRGGGWTYDASDVRSVYRSDGYPYTMRSLGFRLVRP
jgi:formylglycine-generating enzyme required for sulfatase activity